MLPTTYGATLEKYPRLTLVILLVAWKALLLTIVLLSSGPGYDTSTQLLFKGFGTRNDGISISDAFAHNASWSAFGFTQHVVQHLTRWDTIYFASSAERGYILEQEWAFGWGFTQFLAFLSQSTLGLFHT